MNRNAQIGSISVARRSSYFIFNIDLYQFSTFHIAGAFLRRWKGQSHWNILKGVLNRREDIFYRFEGNVSDNWRQLLHCYELSFKKIPLTSVCIWPKINLSLLMTKTCFNVHKLSLLAIMRVVLDKCSFQSVLFCSLFSSRFSKYSFFQRN